MTEVMVGEVLEVEAEQQAGSQAELEQTMSALARWRKNMADHQTVIESFNARIGNGKGNDDLNLALARRQDFQQRRTELLGRAEALGEAVDEAALDREEQALDKQIGIARKAAEREVAGIAVLTKLRNEAACDADTEARRGPALQYAAARALAVVALEQYRATWTAFCDAHAKLTAATQVCDEHANPESGRPRVGGLQLHERAIPDLPALAFPPGVGIEAVRSDWTVHLGRLIEIKQRETRSLIANVA